MNNSKKEEPTLSESFKKASLIEYGSIALIFISILALIICGRETLGAHSVDIYIKNEVKDMYLNSEKNMKPDIKTAKRLGKYSVEKANNIITLRSSDGPILKEICQSILVASGRDILELRSMLPGKLVKMSDSYCNKLENKNILVIHPNPLLIKKTIP